HLILVALPVLDAVVGPLVRGRRHGDDEVLVVGAAAHYAELIALSGPRHQKPDRGFRQYRRGRHFGGRHHGESLVVGPRRFFALGSNRAHAHHYFFPHPVLHRDLISGPAVLQFGGLHRFGALRPVVSRSSDTEIQFQRSLDEIVFGGPQRQHAMNDNRRTALDGSEIAN